MSFEQPDRPWYHVRHDDFSERFFYYGTGGLLDPKNYTVEPFYLSGGGSLAFWKWNRSRWAAFGRGVAISQTAAFIGVGLLGAIFDPLDKNEGGLDEHIGSVYDWVESGNQATQWWQDLPWPDFMS